MSAETMASDKNAGDGDREIAPARSRFLPFRKWGKLASVIGVTLAVGFAIGMRQGRQKLEKVNKPD